MHAIESNTSSVSIEGLSFLWLEITNKCNLTCTHCYADSSPKGDLYGQMTYDDWVRVIDEAAALGCQKLQFIGGEPTLHPKLNDLIDHANHRGFELIEVFTNATHLRTDLIGCFQKNKVHVATSFYSDDASVHEGITQNEGSWQRTVDGIRDVVAAGLPIRVGIIETERNAGHGQRAMSFIKGLGVESVRVDRERGIGRSAHLQIAVKEERFDQLCGQCWKGKLCITPSGETFPCVFARATSLGSAKTGLASILESSRLMAFRTKVQALGESETEAICSPHETCNPGKTQTCAPNTEICSPHETCNPGKTEICSPHETCNPGKTIEICSPHETCNPGNT